MIKSVGYVLWGLAIVSLVAAAFKNHVVFIAAPLLAIALTYSLLRTCLYRPPEDHLGVIYRFGRLSQLVADDEWVFLVPGVVHEVKEPISLHIRRVDVDLTGILTKEQVPIDTKLLVFYNRDLRPADVEFRSHALRIPENGWDRIITNVLRETVNEVVGSAPFQQLLTPKGRGYLKRGLSTLMAERVRRMGLVIDQQRGVSIQALKPADALWEAMMDLLAAASLGEAALVRVRPMLEALHDERPDVAWGALLLEIAGVTAKEGTVPQVLVAPDQGPALAALTGQSQQQPEGRLGNGKATSGGDGKRETKRATVRVRGGQRIEPLPPLPTGATYGKFHPSRSAQGTSGF